MNLMRQNSLFDIIYKVSHFFLKFINFLKIFLSKIKYKKRCRKRLFRNRSISFERECVRKIELFFYVLLLNSLARHRKRPNLRKL